MLYVGTILYGFCDGYFARDSYEDKRIEALGADWVIVRLRDGRIDFAEGENIKELLLKFTDPKYKIED